MCRTNNKLHYCVRRAFFSVVSLVRSLAWHSCCIIFSCSLLSHFIALIVMLGLLRIYQILRLSSHFYTCSQCITCISLGFDFYFCVRSPDLFNSKKKIYTQRAEKKPNRIQSHHILRLKAMLKPHYAMRYEYRIAGKYIVYTCSVCACLFFFGVLLVLLLGCYFQSAMHFDVQCEKRPKQ